ncbi:MAG: hypothetical protein KBT87_08855 [Gammaproteobacteria bacterium]|jgi:general secretion pathway protein C|nr:hypothetical protein [Gammaproteobacteria bacterium]MBQ0774767.1 hypothetical protein [Gammaproteobacteria bacterium]
MATAKQFQLSEPWQQRIRSALMLVLLVWLAWMLASTFWLFVSGPTDPVALDRNMVVLQASTDSADSATSMQRSEEHVRSWELFGPLAVEQALVAEAPETRLRLELLGVFENVEAGLGSAIISEQGKDGDLYHPGDKVPGNATLEEIYGDRVILLRMGQREALRMKEIELSGEVAQVSESSSLRTSSASQDRLSNQSEDGGEDLVEQRNMIISRLGLTPSDSGGYAIGSSAPAQVLQVVGLRSGDVLVSVNGHDVGNEEADIAALQEFRNTGAASIVVQRGAQRFTVNYPP